MKPYQNDRDQQALYLGLAVLGLLLVLWQIWASHSYQARLLVSSPALIWAYITNYSTNVLVALAYTGAEALVGLALATLIALSFSLLLLYLPTLARIFYPWLIASQVILFVCLAPLIILIFGVGWEGKVFLSALMAFFPLVTSIVAGIRSIPKPPIELMQLLNAPKWMLLRHVVMPYCLLPFFAGQRVAAPFSVIGAIVAEFNGADHGLGRDIFIAAKRLEPELMMTGIICGALLSAVIYLSIVSIERTLGDWYWER